MTNEEIKEAADNLLAKYLYDCNVYNIDLDAENYDAGYGQSLKDNLVDIFKRGVKFAQKQLNNEWVSVEEKLPDYSTNEGYNVVLVKLRDGMICTATLMQITQHCFENSPILNKWYVFPSMGNDITNEVNYWKEIK